jgi:hypothetical protein
MPAIDDVIENVSGYVEARIEVIKLDIKDQATEVGVSILVGLLVGFIGIMILTCLSLALALYLGQMLANLPLGFVIVAGIYVVAAFIAMASSAAVQRAVERQVFPHYKRNK